MGVGTGCLAPCAERVQWRRVVYDVVTRYGDLGVLTCHVLHRDEVKGP